MKMVPDRGNSDRGSSERDLGVNLFRALQIVIRESILYDEFLRDIFWDLILGHKYLTSCLSPKLGHLRSRRDWEYLQRLSRRLCAYQFAFDVWTCQLASLESSRSLGTSL